MGWTTTGSGIINSRELEIFEYLQQYDTTGLTEKDIIQLIVKESSNEKLEEIVEDVKKIITDFIARGIVYGHKRPDELGGRFRLNSNDPHVVELVRAISFFTLNLVEQDAKLHGLKI